MTDIHSQNWEAHLKTNRFQSQEYMNRLLEDKEPCKSCPVEYCLRCNHGHFEHSQKLDFMDKWFDFGNQPNLCDYYYINNIVKGAMYKVGGNKLKNGM